MKKNVIFLVKKLLPNSVINIIRVHRKKKRLSKRYLFNNGESFFKKITTQGVTFDILIDPFLNSGVDEGIAVNGEWEPKLSRNLKRVLGQGGFFLDVGANIGYHSLFVSKLIGDKGHVYSFEPQKNICEQFLKSIVHNNLTNVTVFNNALSDHGGTEVLHVREENVGGSTLLSLPEMESFHTSESMNVTLKTLDSYLDMVTRVDVIKIDVEGYEFEVFKGGEKLIEKYHPTIFMEFSPVFYVRDYANKPEDLIIFLKEKGYSFYDLDGKVIDLFSWLERGDNRNSQIDIVCK